MKRKFRAYVMYALFFYFFAFLRAKGAGRDAGLTLESGRSYWVRQTDGFEMFGVPQDVCRQFTEGDEAYY